MPGHYIIKINNRCNMNCLFCADPPEVRSLPDYSYEKLVGMIRTNRERFDSLLITGGEPTIYRRIESLISKAKELGYSRIGLGTNGLMFSNKSFLQRLITAGLDSIQVSYFSGNEKNYSALSRTPKSFKLVTKALSNISKTGVDLRINVVISKINYTELIDIVSNLSRFRVSSITLSFMNPVGTSVVNGKSGLMVTYTKIMPKIREVFLFSRKDYRERIYIENFPICIAPDLKARISDLTQPSENHEYYNTSKVHPKKCSMCKYRESCKGLWKAYYEQQGDSEIKAIK